MSNDTRVKEIYGMEILDSRGNPTVRATVRLTGGVSASAEVPSGASTGTHEAVELRDTRKGRFLKQGVRAAVNHVDRTLAKALKGFDASDQQGIDAKMCRLDGTPQKERMGANAILAVSIACARAAAEALGRRLDAHLRLLFDLPTPRKFPTPLLNVVNGGAHSDAPVDVQEFWIVPIGLPTYAEQLQCGAEIYHHLKSVLRAHHLAVSVGDEGGYAPQLSDPSDVFALMSEAVDRSTWRLKKDVVFGVDVGASEFWDRKKGVYRLSGLGTTLTADELIELYAEWMGDYPLQLLEDGCGEDDWEAWRKLTARFGSATTIIGDDLFVTNLRRLKKGITSKAANAIIIKPNQIGTVTETIETAKAAKAANYRIVVAHRSGDTPDTFIADLAVALGADYVKFGAPARGERTAKYNRLLEHATFGF